MEGGWVGWVGLELELDFIEGEKEGWRDGGRLERVRVRVGRVGGGNFDLKMGLGG